MPEDGNGELLVLVFTSECSMTRLSQPSIHSVCAQERPARLISFTSIHIIHSSRDRCGPTLSAISLAGAESDGERNESCVGIARLRSCHEKRSAPTAKWSCRVVRCLSCHRRPGTLHCQ